MPVELAHPDYDENFPCWAQARDVLSGERTVKRRGEVYLPKLEGQTEMEYHRYKQRAQFLNAAARTHQGLHGMIFRKSPDVTLPETAVGALSDSLNAMQTDCDLQGRDLEQYTREVVSEILMVGRGGTLVDWSEAERRAYLSFYKAESICNWRMDRVQGKSRLTMVVLKETPTVGVNQELLPGTKSDELEGNDPYMDETVEQYRVLRLVPRSTGPVRAGIQMPGPIAFQYVVEIWRKEEVVSRGRKKSEQWVLQETFQPNRNGQPLTEIPFIFHGPDDSSEQVEKLPLDDLISLNLDHYRKSADYSHGMHYTALPTAYVAGFDAGSQLTIGSTVAWVSDNPNAKAAFLEFTGKGLDNFPTYLDRCEKNMAVLGARLLESQKREAETAEAMQIRQGGEDSVLASISRSSSRSMTKALKWVYWWSSTEQTVYDVDDEECAIALNQDFIAAKMGAAELTALTASWVQGGISRRTLHWNLKQGERLPPETTPEEEAEQIDSEGGGPQALAEAEAEQMRQEEEALRQAQQAQGGQGEQ